MLSVHYPASPHSLTEVCALFSIALRRFLFRVHLWTAVSAGLFFVVLAVSGSVLGFQEQLDRALHSQLYDVVPGPQYLPLSAILSSVRNAFPSDDVVAVTMRVSPRDAWEVALPSGIASVNPYTGRVLGIRHRGTAFVGVISQIHVSLACGRIGRTAVRWIDFAALVLLLSGCSFGGQCAGLGFSADHYRVDSWPHDDSGATCITRQVRFRSSSSWSWSRPGRC
jgi:hypothetical protein